MSKKLIIGILLVLFPLSPWIWMAVMSKREGRKRELVKFHLKFLIVIWISIAFIFGFQGGNMIETLAAFY